jgi:peptidyl-prolyl cis-trans isomerase B (cyclophilin B)
MKKILGLLIVLSVVFTACDKNKDAVVIIHTEFGDMKVILYEETPLHKANFLALAREGRYDSTKWHRIIKGFMIQGGNVNEKEGTVEAKSDRIPAEIIDGYYHTKGSLAAARQGDDVNPEKMSSGVQFYIVHGKTFTETELTTDLARLNQGVTEILAMEKYDTLRDQFVELRQVKDYEGMNQLAVKCKSIVEDELGLELDKPFDAERLALYTSQGGAPHLDSEYSVFGRVVEGLDVIDQLAALQVARRDKPVKASYMTMEVAMVPKKKITEMYGYNYPATK